MKLLWPALQISPATLKKSRDKNLRELRVKNSYFILVLGQQVMEAQAQRTY